MTDELDAALSTVTGGAGPVPARDGLDDALEQVHGDSRARLAASRMQAEGANPDQAAEGLRLGREQGVPDAVALENTDQLRADSEASRLDRLHAESPVLARWLSDPANMAVAKDDVENLSAFGKAVGFYRNLGESLPAFMVPQKATLALITDPVESAKFGAEALKSFWTGLRYRGPEAVFGLGAAVAESAGQAQDALGLMDPMRAMAQAFGTPAGDNAATRAGGALLEESQAIGRDAQALAGDRSGYGVVQRGALSGLESLGAQAVPTLISFLTGNPAPMLALMGLQTTGQAYPQARAQGVDPLSSLEFSGGQGLVEVGTELLPALNLFKNLKLGSPVWKTVTQAMAADVPGEQVATVLQDFNEFVSLPENADKTVGDYLAARPGAAAETLVASLVASGTQAGALAGVDRLTDHLSTKAQKDTQARLLKEYAERVSGALSQVDAAFDATKLSQRSPEKAEEVAQALAEGRETVYMPVEEFETYYQSQNVPPAEAWAHLTGDANGYATARATGADLQIPYAKYLARLTPEERKALTPHLRLSPDAMTAAEAEAFGKERESILGDTAQPQQGDPAYDFIYNDLLGQLMQRFPRDVADKYASAEAARFVAFNKAAGTDALADYQANAPKILSEVPEALRRVEFNVEIDPLLERLRAGNVPTEREVRGPSLLEFLRSKGGVQDQGGELSILDAEKSDRAIRTPGQRKLVNPEGLTLDEAREAAVAAGYLTEAEADQQATSDISQLLSAIDSELRGTAVYAQGREDTTAGDTRRALTELGDFLAQSGVDLNTVSNEEIKQFLQSGVVPAAMQQQDQTVLEQEQATDKVYSMATGLSRLAAWKHAQEYEGRLFGGAYNWTRVEGPKGGLAAKDAPMRKMIALGRERYNELRKEFGLEPVTNWRERPEQLVQRLPRPDDGKPIATDTPEFKAWFGDSKVVDAGGKPLVVYHGTTHSFDKFDPAARGGMGGAMGFWFSSEAAATEPFQRVRIPSQDRPQTVPAYLALSNPKVYGSWEEFVEAGRERGKDSIEAGLKSLRASLIRAGHDGVQIKDSATDSGVKRDDFVAFRPEQIKSAIGNRGTFDPNDPNILNQSGKPLKPMTPDEVLDALVAKGLIRDAAPTAERRTVREMDKWLDDLVGKDTTTLRQDAVPQEQPVFYSALTRAVESVKQGKAPAAQWMGMLKNQPGVKAEEIEWTGLEEWLAQQDGSVTKEAVLEFLRANEIKVEEVVKGQSAETQDDDRLTVRLTALGFEPEFDMDGSLVRIIRRSDNEPFGFDEEAETFLSENDGETEAPAEVATAARQLGVLRDRDFGTRSADETQFGQYTLPGAKEGSYRELLLTLPTPMSERNLEAGAQKLFGKPYEDLGPGEMAQVNQHVWNPTPTFRSSHFDVDNILAHVRFNERTDADGKRVLFIEEVQSDWHQKGRREGYAPTAAEREELERQYKEAEAKERPFEKAIRDNVNDHHADRISYEEFTLRARALHDQLRPLTEERERIADRLNGRSVPDAPFKTTWPMLAMKRALRWAVDNGFDRIAWTSGEIQAGRYDLSKKVDRIEYLTNADGTFDVYPVPIGMSGAPQDLVQRGKTIAELEGIVGKEVADKIAQRKGRTSGAVYRLKGLDLKVGGEGMAAFYDKMLPAEMNRYTKKWGGKVGTTELGAGSPARYNHGWVLESPTGQQLQGPFGSRADALAAKAPVHSLDITPAMREAALAGQAMFQAAADGSAATKARGQIRFTRGENRRFEITLKDADLSTFVHEMGHYWLERMGDTAERADAPQQIKDDYAALLKWMGVEGRTGIGTEQHEMFARANEAYLMEGKAPSVKLRAVFARFRNWLLQVYERLTRLNVSLSPEVRGVFDRLYASQQEINEARNAQFLKPLWLDRESAGMSEADWTAYVAASEAARTQAEEELAVEAMAPIRREEQDWWKDKRKAVAEEVLAAVNRRKDIVALTVLRTGKMPDGTKVEVPKLSKGSLMKDFGLTAESLAKLPRGIYTAGEGASADDLAPTFGYASGKELIEALGAVPDKRQLVKELVDAELKRRYPDIIDDGSIGDRAMRAVHSDKAGELLVREAQILADRAKVEGKTAGLRRYQLSRQMAKAAAQQVIEGTPLKDIQPARWKAAEAKAGNEAYRLAREGKLAEAAAAKQKQALNHFLYREAVDALEAVEKRVKHMRDLNAKGPREAIGKAGGNEYVATYRDGTQEVFDSRKAAEEAVAERPGFWFATNTYLEQIDRLLERYDLRARTNRKLASRESLRQFADRLTADGIPHEIPEDVIADARQVNYRELPYGYFAAVSDAVRSIENVALRKSELVIAGQKRDRDEAAAEIRDSIIGNKPPRLPGVAERGRGERMLDAGNEALSVYLNANYITREMDGGKAGAVNALLYRPIIEAAVHVENRKEIVHKAMAELYEKHYSKAELRAMASQRGANAVPVKEIGETWTKWDVVSLALNWGNEGNREAILRGRYAGGRRITQAMVDRLLGLNGQPGVMTAKDWAFAQDVWKYVDSFWPEIRAKQVQRTGTAPEKVAASALQTSAGGQVEGGYYPLQYDSRQGGKAGMDAQDDVFEALRTGRYGRAQTKRGHTEARVGSGGRPVTIGMEVLTRHLQNVVYDLEMGDAISSVYKLLEHKGVEQAFTEAGKKAYHRQLRLWLKDVATGEIVASHWAEQLLRFLRVNFTKAVLTFKVSSAALQITGISQTSAALGPKYTWRGLQQVLSRQPWGEKGWAEQIKAASPAMKARWERGGYNPAVADVMNAAQGKRIPSWVWGAGYWMMGRVQMIADAVTWMGAHAKAVDAGKSPGEALAAADDTVNRAQGSGLFADRSALERGTLSENVRQTEFIRAFTVLMSYMMAKGRMAYEATRNTDFTKPTQVARYTVQMAMIFTVEALLVALIRGQLPGDDDDDGAADEIGMFAAEQTALGLVGTVPGLTYLGSEIQGFRGGPAFMEWAESAGKLAKQVDQGELDKALLRAGFDLAGALTGFPSSQANITLDAFWRAQEGEDVSPIEYLMRVQKDE